MLALNTSKRFSDRMKGILDDEQIWLKDSMAAAHRITTQEDVEDFLRSPEKYLRDDDEPIVHEMTRRNVASLMESDIDNHILCQHLNGHRVSRLVGEALFWKIQLPEGQPALKPSSAEAMFTTYDILEALPPEAHKILFTIYFKGYGLGHSLRVGTYSSLIAQKLNRETEPEIAAIAGLLHDLGKMQAFLHEIVKHPGKLTHEEFETIKLHPVIGIALWNELGAKGFINFSKKDHLLVHNGILEHHVRPDGRGYPDWIPPKKVSEIAQIVAVADSFDAMTSYRKHNDNGNESKKAKEELKRCAGLPWDKNLTRFKESEKQFNPEIVEAFLEIDPNPTFNKSIIQ